MSISLQNILIISSHYYPMRGGTETHCENLCLELASCGYRVTLITQRSDSDAHVENHDASQPYRIIRLHSPRPFKGDMFFPFLIGKRINTYIAEIHPDVINITMGNFVPLGLKLSKKHNIPVIFTVHNVPPEEYTFSYSRNAALNSSLKKIYFYVISRLVRFSLRYGRYSRIISVSEKTKMRLLAAGADEKQISIVPNGVSKPKQDNLRVSKDSEWFTILVTAGVIDHKGQYELVLAMEDILKKIPQARCMLVGAIRNSVYADKILKLCREKGYGEKVVLRGEVTDDELETLYAECDLYIQPSYQEGFCISIMEAMIREKPVIGTAVGAIPELLADGRGIVLEKPDSKLIFDAVIRMYTDKEFCRESARKAKEYVMRQYEWSRVAKETADIYSQELLKITTNRE